MLRTWKIASFLKNKSENKQDCKNSNFSWYFHQAALLSAYIKTPLIMTYPSPVQTFHRDTYAAINPTRPELSAKGKRIVVTGGGYGIGREIVNAFAQAGASTIAIMGRNEKPLQETKKIVEEAFPTTKVEVYIADVTNPEPVEKAAQSFGQWDVLILNAGYLPGKAVVTGNGQANLKEWWKGFEVCDLLIFPDCG